MESTKKNNRRIRKIAILGSGVMGSRIACHFANIGTQVLLLDIVPSSLNEKEKAAGLNESHPAFRNRIVNDALSSTLKSAPSPIFHASYASRIETGNFDDNLSQISFCDWILEAVVENLEIKQNLYEKVEAFRSLGTIITSNTSGIPLSWLAHGRSAHYFRVMKNITLSADGRTIELAREEARSRKTTLNALFREWIEDLAARDERRKNIENIFDELDSHITRIPKLTRDQMNER